MNLQQFGASLLAACVLTGCVSETPQKQSSSPYHDRLTDFADPLLPLGVNMLDTLGVDEFREVKPGLQALYYGVGTLGDLCVVTFMRVESLGLVSAVVMKRYEDAPPVAEIGLTPLRKIGQQVVNSRKQCITQRA